ncbi:hypothetical protein LOD99_2866 [Oopsacas minuta]|uniref:Uncharacterized protein n=1 Tax=Oopsacas minuta TaxID=111878 RepID=A0AAV7K0B3_9METZ|nr:hypothetical protein LOD99_2866 [Oopsacas minuta]
MKMIDVVEHSRNENAKNSELNLSIKKTQKENIELKSSINILVKDNKELKASLTNFHTSLLIMKSARGEEITINEMDLIEKFEWEISDVKNLLASHGSVESSPFNLYGYTLKYRVTYMFGGISISVKRAPGEKMEIQELRICHYYFQLVNRMNESRSRMRKGNADRVIHEVYQDLPSFEMGSLSPYIINDSILLQLQLIPKDII